MEKVFFVFVISFLFFSCEYEEGNRLVTVENKFTVSVPNFMESTDRLSPNSPLQYENKFRTLYVIGHIAENNNNDKLRVYSENAIKKFAETLENIKVTKVTDSTNTIPSLETLEYEIWGDVEEEKVFYNLLFVDAETEFYQICSWTLERRYEAYGDSVRNIINSFKLKQ